jgi:ribosome biogenesis SPOUT family RNA methylase Rps3
MAPSHPPKTFLIGTLLHPRSVPIIPTPPFLPIEHMEPLDPTHTELPTWVLLEYTHMLSLAGPSSTVHFSNLSADLVQSLSSHLRSASDGNDDVASAKVTQEGVEQLVGLDRAKVCLLDPKAEKALEPADVEAFDSFLFGGILGPCYTHHVITTQWGLTQRGRMGNKATTRRGTGLAS